MSLLTEYIDLINCNFSKQLEDIDKLLLNIEYDRQLLKKNEYGWNNYIFREAVEKEDFLLMTWLKNNNCPWGKNIFEKSIILIP